MVKSHLIWIRWTHRKKNTVPVKAIFAAPPGEQIRQDFTLEWRYERVMLWAALLTVLRVDKIRIKYSAERSEECTQSRVSQRTARNRPESKFYFFVSQLRKAMQREETRPLSRCALRVARVYGVEFLQSRPILERYHHVVFGGCSEEPWIMNSPKQKTELLVYVVDLAAVDPAWMDSGWEKTVFGVLQRWSSGDFRL